MQRSRSLRCEKHSIQSAEKSKINDNTYMSLYLSWIEGLTTNQNVIGSNPIRRTNRNRKPPATGAFLLRRHRMDSNLGRGAGVKKTRSVFSPRARTPAGDRSRCVFAKQIRGRSVARSTEHGRHGDGKSSKVFPTVSVNPRRSPEAALCYKMLG